MGADRLCYLRAEERRRRPGTRTGTRVAAVEKPFTPKKRVRQGRSGLGQAPALFHAHTHSPDGPNLIRPSKPIDDQPKNGLNVGIFWL
jgi:hypothetical protein